MGDSERKWRSYWITLPNATVRVDCDERGFVRENHTCFRGLAGMKWDEFLRQLKDEHGSHMEVEEL